MLEISTVHSLYAWRSEKSLKHVQSKTYNRIISCHFPEAAIEPIFYHSLIYISI